MKVRFVPQAEDELEEIVDHIARDNPSAAVRMLVELRAKARAIGRTPNAWPLVDADRHPGIRRRVHKSWLIFYRIEQDHVARDYETLFPPED